MTRIELANKVRDNLNDAGVTYYSAADLNESIQDIYDEMAVYCQFIEKGINIDFENDTTYYDLADEISDYYRVIKIWNPAVKGYLTGVSDRDELNLRQDWELGNYQSREFLILGPRYLGLSGRTSNASGHMQIWYKATAPTLTSDNSILLVNEGYLIVLENGVTADLLEQNQEYSKANTYLANYETGLEDYRAKIKLLAKADRIFTRR